jgi:hypothetical protein
MVVTIMPQLDFVYVHCTNYSDKILQAKLNFKQFATTHAVKAVQYHVNNSRFAEAKFQIPASLLRV